ncbi:MAG: hypothetical protein F6J93_24120 [Oscillatoria sp. SIO1A7]|nr:hypothetical protein [Oscillatoria sp. SIO1A7]
MERLIKDCYVEISHEFIKILLCLIILKNFGIFTMLNAQCPMPDAQCPDSI